jgi:hypothetical protein
MRGWEIFGVDRGRVRFRYCTASYHDRKSSFCLPRSYITVSRVLSPSMLLPILLCLDTEKIPCQIVNGSCLLQLRLPRTWQLWNQFALPLVNFLSFFYPSSISFQIWVLDVVSDRQYSCWNRLLGKWPALPVLKASSTLADARILDYLGYSDLIVSRYHTSLDHIPTYHVRCLVQGKVQDKDTMETRRFPFKYAFRQKISALSRYIISILVSNRVGT